MKATNRCRRKQHLGCDRAREGAGDAHCGVSYRRLQPARGRRRRHFRRRHLAVRESVAARARRGSRPDGATGRHRRRGAHAAGGVRAARRLCGRASRVAGRAGVALAVEGQPWIDEVLVFPRGEIEAALRRGRLIAATALLFRFIGVLRRRRFDLVIDFHAILKSGLLARVSGAPRARELCAALRARRRLALRERARARRAAPHLALRAQSRVSSISSRTGPRLGSAVSRRCRVPARGWPTPLGGDPAPIAIHPGTSAGTPHKRWSAAGLRGGRAPAARRDGHAVDRALRSGPGRARARRGGRRAGGRRRAAGAGDRVARRTRRTARAVPALRRRRHRADARGVARGHAGGADPRPDRSDRERSRMPARRRERCGNPSLAVRAGAAAAAATCLRRVTPDAVFAAARELLAVAARGR